MKTLDTVILASILASLLHIIAFVIYNYKQIFGESRPNLISWFLWACLALLNFLSYNAMSQNWIVSLLSATGSVMCVITFIFAFFKGRFSKPNWVDYSALILGIISILVWTISKSAMHANFIVLLGASIGFIPTYKSVFSNRKNEPSLPWFLWSAAFFLGTLVVMAEFDGKWENFAYPVSMLILHFGVFIKSK